MQRIRTVNDTDFTGKTVLLRVDFNVELDNKKDVAEQYKLEASKKTLEHILSFPGSKVALLSHFGRPKGGRDEECSLRFVVDDAERALGKTISFVDDCIGEKVHEAMEALPEHGIVLLENVRFYPGEESDDPRFATELAAPFHVYVNEAFSVCHRTQASVGAITDVLPSFAGFRLSDEIAKLDEIRTNPTRPAVAVIGGAKIDTKLPLIREFERIYDAVLVGGKVANEAIDRGIEFSEKVLLPKDFQGGDARLDIGPMTAAMFTKVITLAKTIVWNGPLGKFEEKPYDAGTDAVLHAMLQSQANIVIGGGESLAVLEAADLMHKIGYVSTGGGAMLSYLSGEDLPGLRALREATREKTL